MKNLEERIFDYLQKNLNPKRFEHSYCVMLCAVEFAQAHGADTLKTQAAALLHDCEKSKSDKQLIAFFKNRKRNFKYYEDIKKHSPQLLHSYAAAVTAKERFGIKDKDMLNAISSHTLGRENMSLLEKIIFTADSVSHDRKYKHAEKIRILAKKNIDAAFILVLENKIEYIVKNRKWLCPQTIDTWNCYAQNG